MVGLNDNCKGAYIEKLQFYSDKYGWKLLKVRPHIVTNVIWDQDGLTKYICKNMDSEYKINDYMIIEGEMRSRFS